MVSADVLVHYAVSVLVLAMGLLLATEPDAAEPPSLETLLIV